MSLSKKMEVDAVIQAPSHLFHDLLSYHPQSLTAVAPDRIVSFDTLGGESVKEGVVVSVEFFLDGKKMSAKALMEKIDAINHSTTWKITEGDILYAYKTFKATIKATPTESGTAVHWTFEYEKMNDNIPDPQTLMDLAVHLSKAIDSYLLNAQLNTA